MERKTNRTGNLILIGILCLLAFVSACSSENPDGTRPAAAIDSPVTETAALMTPTAMPTPILKPTPTPTPTPTADGPSVFIPRETLPEGQLFESDYYAVLPGEGVYYNVFDCYGNQIDSFLFPEGGGAPPIGLFTAQELSPYIRVNQKDVKTVIPQSSDGNSSILYSSQNGFYQMDSQNQNVILYGKDGQCIRTIKPPKITSQDYVETVLGCLGNETVVAFRTMDEDANSFIDLYFVASDGTISNSCKAINPFGFIGRAYYLTQSDAGDQGICDLVDYSGKVVMKGVDSLPESTFCVRTFIPAMWLKISDDFQMTIPISDTFTKDGILYDSSLHAIQKNQLGADGELIYGNTYDVEGIPCKAIQWKNHHVDYLYTGYADLIAVGTQGDKMAIKTQDAEYVIDSKGRDFYGMNDSLLVLNGKIVISLKTGKVLQTCAGQNEVETVNKYIIERTGLYDSTTGHMIGGCIIDKDGNIRYKSDTNFLDSTQGEYIVLYRGPYVGIADLNGDWVIKTLKNPLTKDAWVSNAEG